MQFKNHWVSSTEYYELLLEMKNQRIAMIRDFVTWGIGVAAIGVVVGIYYHYHQSRKRSEERLYLQKQIASVEELIGKLQEKEATLDALIANQREKVAESLGSGTQYREHLQHEIEFYIDRSKRLARYIEERCMKLGSRADKTKWITAMLKITMYDSKPKEMIEETAFKDIKTQYETIESLFNTYNPGYEVVDIYTDLTELA